MFKENTCLSGIYLATGVVFIVFMLYFCTYLSVTYIGPYIPECVKLKTAHFVYQKCIMLYLGVW